MVGDNGKSGTAEAATLADVAPFRQRNSHGQAIVSLYHNSTIGDALRKLAQHRILSAPVLIAPDVEDVGDLAAEAPRSQLLGWVDVNDIVREFVKKQAHIRLRSSKQALVFVAVEHKVEGKTSMLMMISELEDDAEEMAQRRLETILGGEDRRLVYEGDQTMPLRTAVQRHFLANERGPAVHRIALFDSRGTIEYVISQMDVLRHVLSQDYEKPWVAKTLKDAGLLHKKEITTVEINTPTFRALQLLVDHGRSAVAVVDSEGRLITNLSSSDLRSLQPNHFGVLALPVGEFLGLLHGAVYVGSHAVDGDLSRLASSQSGSASGSGHGGGGDGDAGKMKAKAAREPPPPAPTSQFFAQSRDDASPPVPLVTLGDDATVQQVMSEMVKKHVHRVYIVDDPASELPMPISVVTTSDIMELVAKHHE